MERNEIPEMERRLARFKELDQRAGEIRALLAKIEGGDPHGPCGQGPFTGNTRESRVVATLRLSFSHTRGGAEPVELTLDSLGIHAPTVGRWLAEQLRAELSQVLANQKAI